MPDARQTFRIFISSPGDVVEERNQARLVIEGLRRQHRRYIAAGAMAGIGACETTLRVLTRKAKPMREREVNAKQHLTRAARWLAAAALAALMWLGQQGMPNNPNRRPNGLKPLRHTGIRATSSRPHSAPTANAS